MTGTLPILKTESACTSLRERVRQVTRQIEAQIILQTLEQHRWNRKRTAQALCISYRSLMYKMKHGNLRDGHSRRTWETK